MTDRLLCVAVHDAAAATQPACERIIAAVSEVAQVPLTLLAVPCYRWHASGPEFESWLRHRAAAGDEIALHGYTHVDEGMPRGLIDHVRRRICTCGEGEFSGLPLPEARSRLQSGARWFRDLGLALRGFIAPAWLMSAGSWEALAAIRLDYTCTLGHVVLLPGRQRIASRSVVYSNRNAWCRVASMAWASSLAAWRSDQPLMRFELHPQDADDPAMRRHWQRLLERTMRDRTCVTFADAADCLGDRLPGRALVRTGRT